jgi:acyl dehydratase
VTTTIKEPKDLLELIGQELGTSDWLDIPQSDINLFAEATHDQQWIHVDVERAKTGPFKGPIAHGYLTLSLLIPLWSEILIIENLGMAVNYGLNKVRFPAPVPAGSRHPGEHRFSDAARRRWQACLHRTDGAPLLPVAMTEAAGNLFRLPPNAKGKGLGHGWAGHDQQ